MTDENESAFASVQAKFDKLVEKGLKAGPSLVVVFDGTTTKDKGNFGGSYVEYKIHITDKESGSNWFINKRYNDFANLDKMLKKNQKLKPLTPNLPKTNKMSFAGKGADVTESRQKSLNVYLQEIVSRPVMFYSDEVQQFLELPSDLRSATAAIAEVLSQTVKEGWAEKQGGSRKNWKRRWCRLYPDWTLQYFEDKSSMEPKGLLDLQEVKDIKEMDEGRYKFVIAMKTKSREWKFAYENEKLRSQWLATFQTLMENTYKYKDWLPETGRSFGSTASVPGVMRGLSYKSTLSVNQSTLSLGSVAEHRATIDIYKTAAEYQEEIAKLREIVEKNEEVELGLSKQIFMIEKHLKDNHKVVGNASTEVRLVLDELKKNQASRKANERMIKEELETVKTNYRNTIVRHRELENLIANNKIKMEANAQASGPLIPLAESETIITGQMEKYGKKGKTRSKPKHVSFVALGLNKNYVDWADNWKSTKTSRMKVIGVSTDSNLVSRELNSREAKRVLVFHGSSKKNVRDRRAVFLCKNQQERQMWIDFARTHGVTEIARNI